MEIIKKTYNEETDSHELWVRGKLVLNINDEDMDIVEAHEGRSIDRILGDMCLDLAMKDGV